jgi:hypothetical protein
MTTISVQNSSMNLTELVELARKDLVVLRRKDKTAFALVRLDEDDLDAIALSQNSDFMEMLDKARARYDLQGGISLEEVKRRFAKRGKASPSRKKSKLNI